jgi:hypothetical protein
MVMPMKYAILMIIFAMLVSGCAETPNHASCLTDADCVPMPGCHPQECINSAFVRDYEQPEVCTMMFDHTAAYSAEDCICVQGECQNKNRANEPPRAPTPANFEECEAAGYPILESYPRQCRVDDTLTFTESPMLSYEDALAIAEVSECVEQGALLDEYMYNENSKTWWIELQMHPESEIEGCNPACVVDELSMEAEINWRCTGLIEGPVCVDLCGDGHCDEIVCMGEGCPCPETAASCPEDCA